VVNPPGFQHVSSNLLHLLFQSLHSVINGRATNRRGAAPIGTASLGRRIGVTVQNHDAFNRDGELLGHDLSKRSLLPLTVRR